MTNIDISPEAVEAWTPSINWIGHDHGDPYMRLAKGGMWVSISDYNALSAAMTESRAETAAAYEQIANEVCRWSIAASEEIRALAKPDQTAALDRMIADAEARGMREAAAIAEKQKEVFLSPEYAGRFPTNSFAERFACTEVSNAIFAAIPKGGDA